MQAGLFRRFATYLASCGPVFALIVRLRQSHNHIAVALTQAVKRRPVDFL
jgi:hypothetical protein